MLLKVVEMIEWWDPHLCQRGGSKTESPQDGVKNRDSKQLAEEPSHSRPSLSTPEDGRFSETTKWSATSAGWWEVASPTTVGEWAVAGEEAGVAATVGGNAIGRFRELSFMGLLKASRA